MTPVLYNPPVDVSSWLFFGAVHQLEHLRIVEQIYQIRQLRVLSLPIDPIPIAVPALMLTWFQNHQGVHNAANAALDIGGFDLSYVDFRNREQAANWIERNAAEHRQIDAVIAKALLALKSATGSQS